jgi:predicted metal-dependent HD superfamily phosphohydrolase
MQQNSLTKLNETYVDLLFNYRTNRATIYKLWDEISLKLTESHRHYHHFGHLENLIHELEPIKAEFYDWNAVLLSVFYHDVIYYAIASDNEEQSAELAKKHLVEVNCHQKTIDLVYEMIMATKSHQIIQKNDINLFTDADLAILGAEQEVYQNYAAAIRQEYSVFPDPIYIPGRKKVLLHFLKMERIFKTDYFFQKYEEKARINIENEFKSL